MESDHIAETQDISSGGLFLVASTDWTVGTEIECELQLPVKAFASRAIAIRCRGRIARVVPQNDGRMGFGATIEHYEFFPATLAKRAN